MKSIVKTVVQLVLILTITLLSTHTLKASVNTNCVNNYKKQFYTNNLMYKDGKWKARWKELGEGFLDGFKDAVKPIHQENNDYGLNNRDYELLNTFMKDRMNSKESLSKALTQLEKIVKSNKNAIDEKELMSVFYHDNRLKQLIDKIKKHLPSKEVNRYTSNKVSNKTVAVKKETMTAKRGINIQNGIVTDKYKTGIFRAIGYVIGWIGGNLVKGKV